MAAKGGASRTYTDADLLDPIREFVEEHGRAPSVTEYDEYAEPSERTTRGRIGDWQTVIEAAGFDYDDVPKHPVPQRENDYTDEEMLDWLVSFKETFGVVPAKADLQSWPGPHYVTYKRRFGNFTTAMREAGLEPRGDR